MQGRWSFFAITTAFAVIIVLQSIQHISLISKSKDETSPILMEAPIETNRDKKAPLVGDRTTNDEVWTREETIFNATMHSLE